MIHKFCTCILVLLLTACATTVKGLKQVETTALKPNEGYLLIGLDTQVDLKAVYFDGELNFKLTEDDVEKGSDYILVKVPAGNYRFEQIDVTSDKVTRYMEFPLRKSKDIDIWQFRVEPNNINYIGHLNFKNFRPGSWSWSVHLTLENRSSRAHAFVNEQ